MQSILTFVVAYALIPAVLFCWVAYEWYGLKRERRGDNQTKDDKTGEQ